MRRSIVNRCAKSSNFYTAENDGGMNSDSADSPNPPSPIMFQGQDKEQFRIKVGIYGRILKGESATSLSENL